MSGEQRFIYVTDQGLIVTDGTLAGTMVVKATTSGFIPAGSMAALDGREVVFAASAGPGSIWNPKGQALQLWVSDGTPGGTSLVDTFADSTPASRLFDTAGLLGFIPFGSRALFFYNDGIDPAALWITDGTPGGTYQLPNSDGALLGLGTDGKIGTEFVYAAAGGLVGTDGTPAGTTVIKATVSGFKPAGSTAVLGGDKVVFAASSGGSFGTPAGAALQLWVTDGTPGGTSLLETFADNSGGGSDNASLSNLVSVGSQVLFFYNDGTHPQALWRTDGTLAGTYEMPYGDGALGFAGLAGDKLIINAGLGLVATDGTLLGTAVVKPAGGGFLPAGSMVTLGGGQVVFAASSGGGFGTPAGAALQLWATDGTPGGTSLVQTFTDNTPAGNPFDYATLANFTAFDGRALFSYNDGGGTWKLWVTDGTPAGTFQLPDSDNPIVGIGAGASIACYVAGTRIATPAGPVPVEDLRAGQAVLILDGARQAILPIKWIGRRRIDPSRHPRPESVFPVRIRRDAFADGIPHHDLLVSPDHCIVADGALIPARLLVNNMTVVVDRSLSAIEYYHLELDRHCILLAESLPAESYLDTGNRDAFANAPTLAQWVPDFGPGSDDRTWRDKLCAPLFLAPEDTMPTWRRLAERARALGHQLENIATTDDADLRLVANGRVYRPARGTTRHATFILPSGISEARVVSRSCIVSEALPETGDSRRLGVAIGRIVVRNGAGEEAEIPIDAPLMLEGWHAVERGGGRLWRWTDGEGSFRLPPMPGPLIAELTLAGQVAYPVMEPLAA